MNASVQCKLCPDAALRRRLIRVYIAGDESEGYTLGIAGGHSPSEKSLLINTAHTFYHIASILQSGRIPIR